MSYLSMLFNKYYHKDIVEASDGLFLTVCDSIDMRKSANDILKLNVSERDELCDRYNFGRFNSVSEMNSCFTKYIKYTQHDLFNELRDYLGTPKISQIQNIYGNSKIINADILMEVSVDTKNYVADKFYKVINPYKEQTFFDNDKKESLIKTISYFIQVSFSIDGLIKNFKIHNVSLNKPTPRIPEHSISFSANMVPSIKSNDMPLLTCLFMNKYDVLAPVDIEKVIYNVGLFVNDTYELEDTQALICLTDGLLKVKGQVINASENTIYIDKNLKDTFGMGCYRFVILHEAIHFEYHNYYLTLRRLASNCDEKHSLASNILKKTDDKYSDISRIEWQANSAAAQILVPTDMLSNKLVEKIDEYSYYTSSNREALINKICKELAVFFKCSYQVMAIRINQVGMFDIKLKTNETTFITKDEALEVYKTNDTFKYLIDTRKVVYRHNRCVINKNKYFNNNTITSYAFRNPEESMLIFAKVSRNGNNSIFFLTRKGAVKDLAYNVKDNNDINEFLGLENLQDIVNEDSYRNLMRNTVGETLKNIRTTKKIGIGTLSIRTCLSEHTIMQIEEDEYPSNVVIAIAKLCKCLYLPLEVALNIYSKLKTDFDEYWESKIVYKMLIKFYDKDTEEEFIERLNRVKTIAKTIEENNVVLK